jgi:hypothetical protein
MTLVGLVGRARSGKDTVAGLLGLPILKLAQPVKDAVRVLYGWTDHHIEGNLKDIPDPRFDVTPRSAMIHLTDVMKKRHGPEFFSKRLLDVWDGTSAIITDVRYQEDLDMLRARGAVFVLIERPGCSDHRHEDSLAGMKVDYVIPNTGTVGQLQDVLGSLRRELKGRIPEFRDR